jgi:hypothetical protein
MIHACSMRKPMNNLATLKREYLDALFLAKPHLATLWAITALMIDWLICLRAG